MIFFTADLHFTHEAIIKWCNRPFKNATVMDSQLIKNYNSVVTDEDVVYFVGDLTHRTPSYIGTISNLFKKMNGEKHLILGNHDVFKPFSYITDLGFTSVHTSLVVEEFVLNHDPAAACIDKESVWLCGHVHDLFVHQRNVLNVGVDVWDYAPVSIEEVRQYVMENM